MAAHAVGILDWDSTVRLDNFFIGRVVTRNTQTRRRAGKKLRLCRFMRLMTERALPHGRRRMDLRPRFFHHVGELRMAAKTKLRRVFLQLSFECAAVRIVACGAVLFRGRVRALDVLSPKNVAVAGQTKLRAFCGDEFRIRAGMGYVAGRTSANLERRMHLGAFELAQHIAVAGETKLVFGLYKIRLVVARVGAVAARAGAVGDGSMHVDLVELFFLVCMARVTERLDWEVEKRGIFRAMRVVARRALFGAKWIMNRFAF